MGDIYLISAKKDRYYPTKWVSNGLERAFLTQNRKFPILIMPYNQWISH